MSQPSIEKVRRKLRESLRQSPTRDSRYTVPPLWISGSQIETHHDPIDVNPHEFFLETLLEIERRDRKGVAPGSGGSWSRDAVVYNMFVRSSAAFDHNRNGKLDLPANSGGWRETGSFLKATALLPYIQSLGANVVHLLPITSVGSDGNKGTLGSPYAIRNPYELDKNLAEPNLFLQVEDEFRAFVEAAHHLGIRVVVEFVFRTAAKDADWVKENPGWFYWIRESVKDRRPGMMDGSGFGPPIFTPDELKTILKSSESENYEGLIPPHQEYRDFFTPPPQPGAVKLTNGRYIATVREKTTARIPGAFADWPPDDSQPPWGDVTFLRMYDHPDFNYIAYNTIRMYDARLARPENANRPLWEKISEIIPYYQKSFGIDGVMIDMGHALPMDLKKEMIRRARAIDRDFAFWDENFSIEEKSVKEGYNAVIGYQWSDQHKPEKFKNLLRRFSRGEYPLPFFATPESHNTPRAATRPGGMTYSRYAWVISNFIPAIPFIHSGFELGERCPVNTGLDFTREELAKYPSEKLPLFSESAYDWINSNEITNWIRTVSGVRRNYQDLLVDPSPESFYWIEVPNKNIIAFIRSSTKTHRKLLVVANSSMTSEESFSIELPLPITAMRDLLSDQTLSPAGGKLSSRMKGGQVAAFEL
ncbi:MAG TPA: alpha-glucosidase C-terminal domain-containing protein [Bacteroidota bacterium]|nr:alpha-glucosidase C-terminal domain-containing protein [Bacteroidota bacterium]